MRGYITAIAVLFCAGAVSPVAADILIGKNGVHAVGKLISKDANEYVFQQEDGQSAGKLQHLKPDLIVRAIIADDHGAVAPEKAPSTTQWSIPPEPVAPPVVANVPGRPTYCLIPLHGEVGATILADALDKCLADAVKRRPTVIVLDIDSPGGLVEEARSIIKVLHKYNKQARIVALTDKDLSAAAIFTLSVKEIYVKSSSTIGAATSFVPGKQLSAKIEEKMQSAWRAAARNSAEEGGHEPLLAEAMIDNDMELHLEKTGGKPRVVEGPGEHVLCRKGRILTLTSHEAVECGLAAGEADDLNELAAQLKMGGWTECKGLGTLMADYLPKREEALKKESEKILASFEQNIQRAVQSAPAGEVSQVVTRTNIGPRRIIPGPRPGVYQPQQTTVETRVSHTHWKRLSLTCVVALQDAEADLQRQISLCNAFGQDSAAGVFQTTLTEIGALRARIYDDRNKYGAPTTRPANNSSPVAGAGNPPVPSASLPDLSRAVKMQTNIIGGRGGQAFTQTGSVTAPVIGFRFLMGFRGRKQVIKQFDPIFATAPASTAPKVGGTITAKDGYAVAGLDVTTDSYSITAVQVIFARYRDGQIDIADSYRSDWIGVPAEGSTQLAGGNFDLVVGTCGRKSANLDALGILVVKQMGTPKQN
jgi:hypothetical protein